MWSVWHTSSLSSLLLKSSPPLSAEVVVRSMCMVDEEHMLLQEMEQRTRWINEVKKLFGSKLINVACRLSWLSFQRYTYTYIYIYIYFFSSCIYIYIYMFLFLIYISIYVYIYIYRYSYLYIFPYKYNYCICINI